MQKEVDRLRCVYHDDCDESLDSVAKKQWPSTLRQLLSVPLSQTSVRRTAWMYLYRCRAGGADNDEYDDDDELFYRIRRRGELFRWGGFRRISSLRQSARAKSLYRMRRGNNDGKTQELELRLRRRFYFWYFFNRVIVRSTFRIESILCCTLLGESKAWEVLADDLISILYVTDIVAKITLCK